MGKKTIGDRNRTKGHNGERLYAKIFNEILGFKYCVTSRYGSRIHDDAGIDLINLPFNVQIKTGKQRGMNPSQVLSYMKGRIKELFPKSAPEQEMASIVIHRKDVGQGRKRNAQDDLVFMSFEDFTKFLNKIEWD